MGNDLRSVDEHPCRQKRASSDHWQNKKRCAYQVQSQDIENLVNYRTFIFYYLSQKRPVQSRAEKHFFILLTSKVFYSPESNRNNIELGVIGNVPRIEKSQLQPNIVLVVADHIPRKLNFLCVFRVFGSDKQLKRIYELHSLVLSTFHIGKVNERGVFSLHRKSVKRLKLSSILEKAVIVQRKPFFNSDLCRWDFSNVRRRNHFFIPADF